MTVDLSVANKEVLGKALTALGYTMQGNIVSTPLGYFSIEGNAAKAESQVIPAVNALRVEYSKQAITYASQKFGWRKQQVAANKFVLAKGV